MKKVLLYSVLSILLSSCKVFSFLGEAAKEPSAIKQIDFCLKGMRMMKKMDLNYYYGKKSPFVFENNAIFIPCKINDTTYLVFYENGSIGLGTTLGFLTEKISGNVELPKCNKTIKLKKERKMKNKIFIKSGLKYYDVESDFFNFKNLVSVVTSTSNDTIISKSASEKSQNRFVMNDILFDNVMFLSFSDTTITLFDSISVYDTTGYTFVKSLSLCTGFTIFLTVDSIEYAFLFSTVSKEFLSLPQYKKCSQCSMVDNNFKCDYAFVEYEKHKKEQDSVIEGFKENSIFDLVMDTMIVQQTNAITMGDLNSITGNILFSQKNEQPVMGMAFISQFDWIIDMYKQKVYVKKIN